MTQTKTSFRFNPRNLLWVLPAIGLGLVYLSLPKLHQRKPRILSNYRVIPSYGFDIAAMTGGTRINTLERIHQFPMTASSLGKRRLSAAAAASHESSSRDWEQIRLPNGAKVTVGFQGVLLRSLAVTVLAPVPLNKPLSLFAEYGIIEGKPPDIRMPTWHQWNDWQGYRLRVTSSKPNGSIDTIRIDRNSREAARPARRGEP